MYRYRHACMGVGTCTCMWRPEVGIHCLPQLLSNLIHRGRVSHLNAYSIDSSCLHSQLALKPLSVPHKENARGRGGRPHVPRLTGVLGIQIQIPALAWQACYHQTIFLSTPRSFCFLLSFWLLLSELMGSYSDARFLEWEHWLVWGRDWVSTVATLFLLTCYTLTAKTKSFGASRPILCPTWSRQQTSDEGWRERIVKSLLIASAVLWPMLVIKVLPLSHSVQINSFPTGLALSDTLLRNLGAFFLRNYLSGYRDGSVVRSTCFRPLCPKDQSLVPSTLIGLLTTNITPVLGDLTYCYDCYGHHGHLHTCGICSLPSMQIYKKREKVANKIWFFNHGSNVSSYGIPGTDSWDPNSIAFEA